MEIYQDHGDTKGSFFIIDMSNNKLAEMTYSQAGPTLMIIDHTEVSDQLRGKGAGKQMVMHAVEYARSHDLKILPLCPFAKSVFEKVAEIRDVLK